MNEIFAKERERAKTLLIVEGNHEKNTLFSFIIKCFPKINIRMEDIIIYHTNIYLLYQKIEKVYEKEAWWEEDIDIAFVISDEKVKYRKRNFKNIFLVFDYERHDPGFEEEKILRMQEKFCDASDMGKLFLNYPMVESYEHLKSIPDPEYKERKIEASILKGKEYKSLVRKESAIQQLIQFPEKLNQILIQHYGFVNGDELCQRILDISQGNDLMESVENILGESSQEKQILTAVNHCCGMIRKLGYLTKTQSYWEYMKYVLSEIIIHNIRKANYIQEDRYDISEDEWYDCFNNLDFHTILMKQNLSGCSRVDGFIWVLNTCVLLVAEYRFFWRELSAEIV